MNLWLWPQLLPGVFDEGGNSFFVAIGTLLNDWLPHHGKKAIFGAGVGYSKKTLPIPDHSWHFYFVRGPLSARALGLPQEQSLTDAAVAVRLLGSQTTPVPKKYAVSYMPHWRSNEYWPWESICQQIGIHFINPVAGVPQVLDELQASELVLTEALHGAIIADAFRVPWVPVRAYKHILRFKWDDWCAAVQLPYQPVPLPPLYQADSLLWKWHELGKRYNHHPMFGYLTRFVEKGVQQGSRVVHPPLVAEATRRLAAAVHNRPWLSTDQTLDRITEQLDAKLATFRQDYADGRFHS